MEEPSNHASSSMENNGREEDGTIIASISELPVIQLINQPNKNSKFNDRISALPDSLIQHILSFLQLTKDAVKTSALSRRWRHLWTHTPVLIFHYCYDEDESYFYEHYCEFIEKCISIYSSSKLKKFLLQLDYPHYCMMNPRIESWILFAMNREVEELSLEFCVLENYAVIPSHSEAYLLPQFFYRYYSLIKLKTQFCDFVPEEKVAWRSLQILYVGHAKFTDEVMKNILAGSPSLESLELNSCDGIHRLDIKSKSLKRLVIYHLLDLSGGQDHSYLEICGPYLEHLRILGSWEKRKCKLLNVSSLISVVLDFQLSVPHGDVNEYQTLVRSLLEKVHHAKKLKIGTWCVEVLSLLELKTIPSPLSTRKCLILNFRYFNKLALPGIRSLLHSSPELEKLVIKISHGISLSLQFYYDQTFANTYAVEENFWASKTTNFSCLLLHLKTIEIFSMEEYLLRDKHAIELVEFLLKNARVLEKIVISEAYPFHVRNKTDHLLKVAQKLLSVPRSSPHAVVSFPISK